MIIKIVGHIQVWVIGEEEFIKTAEHIHYILMCSVVLSFLKNIQSVSVRSVHE